ncbi:Clp protease N-terminal domain-containing protein [Streptomyces sp. NPDC048277]|uniref:Clp protease N-terminal domain-containing protein n=1 Tax=Streptomyces sp. NPDC048277 TaxID=3155027 RepID=UPI0033F12BE0
MDRARSQARELKHAYVEPGHILLALLDLDEENVVTILEARAEGLRAGLVSALGKGTVEPGEFLPLTGEATAVLELAPQEADRLGHDLVGPLHVLLALLSAGNTLVADVLAANLVDPRQAHSSIAEPEITSLTRDLTVVSGPVIGRATEIDRVLQTLTRRDRRFPLLTGEPGVGKEAVAMGVARAVAEGQVPAVLQGRRVRALDLAAVLADPRHRARGNALIAGLLNEVKDTADLLIYLNGALTPLHLPEGTTTPLGLLRPLLDTPGVLAFGDCGPMEYGHRDPDPGLDRLIQPIPVAEPTDADVLEILRVCRARLAHHHAVTFTDESLAAAAALARDHVPDRALPGSAIGLLDEAAALARTHAARTGTPPGQDPDHPLTVTDIHVAQALAAASGIRTPAPATRATTPPAHDPYVWAMS